MFAADNRWRKETDSKYDESSPQSRNTQRSQRQQRGVASEGGFQFEIKMAAVIGLRGLGKMHEFELYSNIEEAGNFDDLVYTGGDRRYFIQLKHSGKPNKTLQKKDLIELLEKCFRSYRKIKNDKKFKDMPMDKTEVIIYTNRKLDPKLTWRKTEQTSVDIFFKTSDKEIFNFNPDEKENEEIYTLLVNAGVGLGDPGHKALLSEFLKKVIIVTDQEAHWKLDNLIADEIYKQDEIKVEPEEYNMIFHHFKMRLETWWRKEKRGAMTPKELKNWLQSAKTEHYNTVVNSLCNNCKKKPIGTGIKFADSEMKSFKENLSNKRAVHLRSDALTLCSILLLDCLPQSNCIFVTFESLQSNKNMLLHAWLGGHWEWLIVFCDSTVRKHDISDTCLEISEIMNLDTSTKHVIILTACSAQEIKDFITVKREFNFEQLSKKSQEIVLDKKIDFQGRKVTMRSVLQRHGNVEHVLGTELVTDLITEETPVNIGGTLQVNEGYYVPRVLRRKIYLHLNVLEDIELDSEVFSISGMTKDELLENVITLKNVEKFSTGGEVKEIQDKIFILSTEYTKTCFSELCKTNQKETLHWLKYKPEDRKFLWKQSRGATDNLLDYVDHERTHGDKRIIEHFMKHGSHEVRENSIWALGERTVLVVADPGMGKSRTTTYVARHTKKRYPTSWVLRINWSDHTRKLQEMNAETFNFDSLVEFLYSAAIPESKYTDINRSLLKEALQSSGNVTVLMDGFDEISQFHIKKADAILSELMKTKVERVWVTTSPVQRERLEKELSVTAFSMKKLSDESQKQLLRSIWKERAKGDKEACLDEYVKDLLLHTNKSVGQENFTGCPLYIVMIASAFEENLEMSLETAKISLPDKLDLLVVYDRFIERKLHIYETEKKRVDWTNVSNQDDHESWMEIYMENLEKCSLLVTLSSELNPLSDAEMQTTIQPFVERIQAGKDKIGIVMNVVEDRPQFVHRTFAEYLTARWLSKNFKSNRSLLERILFDSSYGIVKDVFDRILARGCPLHCAVLDWNTQAVETLLEDNYDVNAVDSGGRTAMHLTAAQNLGDDECEDITSSLLRCGASVDTEDDVLHFTPLGYAIKAENWLVVERLLEKECNTTDLELIRQSADDESYIGRIIYTMQYNNYPLLSQHIANICANTKWAPLVDAVVARL